MAIDRAFSIYHKIPENSGNFGGKCLSVKDVFHYGTLVPFIPGFLSPSHVFPAKIQNGGTTLVVERNARLLFGRLKRVSLIHSDDDIPILTAVITYVRCDLYRNKGFYENISPAYTIDEFKSHFRMTRGTFEALCRDVQATGRVPKFLNQEPGHVSETEHL